MKWHRLKCLLGRHEKVNVERLEEDAYTLRGVACRHCGTTWWSHIEPAGTLKSSSWDEWLRASPDVKALQPIDIGHLKSLDATQLVQSRVEQAYWLRFIGEELKNTPRTKSYEHTETETIVRPMRYDEAGDFDHWGGNVEEEVTTTYYRSYENPEYARVIERQQIARRNLEEIDREIYARNPVCRTNK